jgi:hypothetical protein
MAEVRNHEPQPSPLEGLYHRFFNRPPDPQGLKSYQEALQKGQTLTEVAWIFGHSEEYQKRVQKHTSNPQAAVNLLFRSLLNREPDPSGNTYYQERLKRGDGVVEITEQIQTSEEYRTKAIQQLYQELLRRAADPSGLADKLGSGLSIPEIASKIRRSEEYRSQTGRGADKTQKPHPHINHQSKVEQLIGHHPELRTPEEKRAWLISHNRNIALDHFINAERQWLHQHGPQEWRDAKDWQTKWLSNRNMLRIANEHALPMVFILDGGHARVLTRPPERLNNGRYRLHVYNPFYEDELQEIIKPDRSKGLNMLHYSNSVPAGVPGFNATYDYDSVIKATQDIRYDLTIPNIPGKEWLTRAKRGALQINEGYNCTLWCIFYAAIANSMKPGFNEFKFGGHEKWVENYGIYLFKYEDVVPEPKKDFKIVWG